MIACPQCGKKQSNDVVRCEGCGYNFEASRQTVVMDKPTEPQEELPEETVPQEKGKARKPFYKKPVVILAALLLVVSLVGLGVFLYLANLEQSSYQNSVSDIWDSVITSSNSLKNSLTKTKDVDDFSQLSEENSNQTATLKDQLVEAKALNPPAAHQDTQKKLEKALRRYIDYLTNAQTIMEEPLETETDTDFVELSSLASEARVACQEVVDSTDFIDEDVPAKVFTMPQLLRPIVKEAQEKEQTKKQKEAETKEEQQQQAEQEAAEDAVKGWMEALRDGNTSAMSDYMTTEAYQKINPGSFEGDYTIEGYKITQTTQVSLTEFEIKATEYDQWTSGDKTTTTRLFSVVKIGNQWLIDEQHTLY